METTLGLLTIGDVLNEWRKDILGKPNRVVCIVYVYANEDSK